MAAPTTAGSNYRVNERGTPEIYSEGGKDYLMNSGGGTVTPMEKIDAAATGGDVSVIIENYGPPVQAEATKLGPNEVKIVISEIARQVNENQGSFPQAMRSNYNLQRKSQ